MIPGRRTGSTCIGIVIYPDGSQAEVWDIEQSHLYFKPLVKPRRLTLAPFGLLVAVLFMLVGCVHLPVKGDKPICLLDMKSGVRSCNYDTWQACHADMQDYQQCYHR